METSKLEAVYFQPGFRGKSTPATPVPGLGVRLPPAPRLQAGDWKRDPGYFFTDSPILLERMEAVLRAPSPEGKA